MIHRIVTNGKDVVMMAFDDSGASIHPYYIFYRKKTDLFYPESSWHHVEDVTYKTISLNEIPADAKVALVRTLFTVDEPSSAEIEKVVNWMAKYL
jgi:hypothetical protein